MHVRMTLASFGNIGSTLASERPSAVEPSRSRLTSATANAGVAAGRAVQQHSQLLLERPAVADARQRIGAALRECFQRVRLLTDLVVGVRKLMSQLHRRAEHRFGFVAQLLPGLVVAFLLASVAAAA